jgi:class 3 adenylate cyclase/tetratricopeptide (TPR) repeat protein
MATCLLCGTENANSAKFCNECAAPLPATSAGRRERRVVSVVFADLVGFTSRAEQLDVEDVEDLLGRYHALLRRELERHGGTVEKFIGDAVMALFGAPVAHEDDPERAVRAALAIQETVAELRERDEIDLHVRIGVTTGEALVALGANPQLGEAMASGDVVNTAARLESAAPADGVLVDEFTYRATERAILLEAAEPVAAKGKSQTVAVWRAVAPRSLRPEHSRVTDAPLVGREREAEALVGALARSQAEPSAQLVTLVGSPGIGKTRLVEELWAHVDRMPDLVTWRQGRSLAYGEGIALWALGEMVKGQAGILESDAAEQAGAKLRHAVNELIRDEHDRDWVERQLRPLVGLDAAAALGGESGRVEAFAAWRRFFEALAEAGPAVLVFEDVHWADDALLDFVDLLTERAGDVPLLIVCTARPELLERRPMWGGGKTNSATLSLAPLSAADTARLVAGLLEEARLPVTVRESLLARAEGNPLYAQEYVRMLQDRGLLVSDGGEWHLAGDIEGLPESVQGIIAARLDTLSDEEKVLVQDAAVVGRTAWVGAVCALSDHTPQRADEIIHSLERKQLVRRNRRSSFAGEIEFTFGHALTQEVAYSQIRRSGRAEKHERAGGWIEGLPGQRDDKAELLAHHYLTALELRRRAGEDAAVLEPKVRAALVEAAHQAEAVNAHAAAARHARAALELTPADDAKRAPLLLDYATAQYRAAAVDETTLTEAVAAQIAASDWRGAAWAEYMLGDWTEHVLGEGERADGHYARAAEFAARVSETEIQSLVAYSQAARLNVTGQAEDSIAFIDKALRGPIEAGDDRGRALLVERRGWSRMALGDAGGIEDSAEGARLLALHAHPRAALAHSNLAEGLAGLGKLDEAREARTQALWLAERSGEPTEIAWVQLGQAEGRYHAGEWDEAQRACERHVDDADRLNSVWARFTRGLIALARGDTELARGDADAIRAYAASSDNAEAGVMGLALNVLVLARAGDDAGGRAALQEFLAKWPTGGAATRAPVLAEVAVVIGRSGPSGEIAHAASLLATESRWREAIIATAEGRHAESSDLYRAIGSRPMCAHAQLLAAYAAEGEGPGGEAADGLLQALAFYEEVAATACSEAARGLSEWLRRRALHPIPGFRARVSDRARDPE